MVDPEEMLGPLGALKNALELQGAPELMKGPLGPPNKVEEPLRALGDGGVGEGPLWILFSWPGAVFSSSS